MLTERYPLPNLGLSHPKWSWGTSQNSNGSGAPPPQPQTQGGPPDPAAAADGCGGEPAGAQGGAVPDPEIRTTPGHGLELVVPSGKLTFTTGECATTELCELARQVASLLAKFDPA